ncbi:hypothetical protein ABZ930_04545 [Streptomyces sp. NPDC046716]|uniref:hypothetical protein n=1 Tax=Streptomyces sp. NPDC046716 TaxID=3157093 RepID=UPI0033D453A2
MTATISVRVEGPVGLDEPEELRAELARETALQWRLEAPDEERGTLDGGVSALLIAVLTSATGAVVQAAAQRAIDAWRGRRLDPPPVTVIVLRADQQGESPRADDDSDGDTPALPEGS